MNPFTSVFKESKTNITRTTETHANIAVEEAKFDSRPISFENIKHADETGETAAHFAATNGSNRVLNDLKEWGQNLNAEDNDGQTPMSCAETKS